MAETPAQHPTCVETTTIGDLPNRTYVCGEGCPRPAGPDPARDARIDAYRNRERRRAARALDRYVETLSGGDPIVLAVAGEHLLEVVGDYILARLGDIELNVQQKSHYGAPIECTCKGGDKPHDSGLRGCIYGPGGVLDGRDPLTPHNADSGAPEVITTTDRDHALHVQNRDPVSWCRQCVGPFFDEHPPGLCDRPSCCTPMSEVRKAQGRPPA